MSQLNFDASQVAPDMGIDPVPAGWYNVMVDESEVKPTRDGTGARLAVRFNIIDGQFAGRKIFTGYNIRNANPVAQEIAFKQLSALAHAVGVLQVADSQQLHGIPLKVKVKIKKATDDYEASNEVTACKNINENVGDGGAASTGPAAPAAPAGFGSAPAAPAAAAAAAAAPAAGWGAAPAQPWGGSAGAAPAAPAAPSAPAPAAPAFAPFPPEGWVAHPTSPGYFYKGQEVKSEAELRAMSAVPAAPPAPPAIPAAPAAPDPAAVAGAAVPPWQQPKS